MRTSFGQRTYNFYAEKLERNNTEICNLTRAKYVLLETKYNPTRAEFAHLEAKHNLRRAKRALHKEYVDANKTCMNTLRRGSRIVIIIHFKMSLLCAFMSNPLQIMEDVNTKQT